MEENKNKDEIKEQENKNQENLNNEDKNPSQEKDKKEEKIQIEPKYTIDLGKKKEEKENNDPPKEKEKEKEKNNETPIQEENNSNIKEKANLSTEKEKGKRHRRGKNEMSDRIYKCPECDKSYLSGPALVIHRKTKHNYMTENEKIRGRPKKENQQDNSQNILLNKYNEFFNSETRKKNDSEEENNNDNTINLDTIKDNLNQIFKHGKLKDLFPDIDTVENYPFYQLLIKNWDIDSPEIRKESYFDNYKMETLDISKKSDTPPLDDIFFLYLKEFSKKTNKKYFWFINKFIVLYREFINEVKKESIKDEFKTDNKTEFSELFCAEGIPESCNDFFLEFMEPKEYFGLNNSELIELTQHFCFWLYQNKYSHSYLTLMT